MITPIAGGHKIGIDSVPYQAKIVRNHDNLDFCGAAIIDKFWLITAAHCLVYDIESFHVQTGSHITSEGIPRNVEKAIAHPDYNTTTYVHDIGLIKLKTSLEFSEKQRNIALSSTEPEVNDVIIVSGYGIEKTDEKLDVRYLRVALIPVVDRTWCRSRYALINCLVDESVFCAGDGLSDTCGGDSGGPAVMNNKLVGITSSGVGCLDHGLDFFPGKYTRIDVHLDWIRNVTGLTFESETK